MLKLHHYEHNNNYLGLKPMSLTREKNLHTKHCSKNICALNPCRQKINSLEYMGVLTKSNIANEQPHPTVGIELGNFNCIL
jgi:hypothetical protein